MKKVEKLANEIRESMQDFKPDLGSHLESINTILNKHAPIEKPFPKHMITNEKVDDSYIIYFIRPKVGYFFTEGDGCYVGEYLENFNMDYFKDCEITIK